jgi:hypothetical protein
MSTHNSTNTQANSTPVAPLGLLDGADDIGGIFDMSYDSCRFTTNDFRVEKAGGLPRKSFLLATAVDESSGDFLEDHAVLLRVDGRTELPDEPELTRLRENVAREAGGAGGTHTLDVDKHTKSEMQRTAFNASIVGMFYDDGGDLAFGNDVPNISVTADYHVFKPSAEALEIIASYPVASSQKEGTRVGRVRYASAEPASAALNAPVHVDVGDFVGAKTALFGMTRTGKSNAMKILATATAEYGAKTGRSIGQLLFDPSGEYANENQQDEKALGEVESAQVRLYGWDSEDDDRQQLNLNFFESKLIRPVWGLIRGNLTRDAIYVDNFKNADVIGPESPEDDRSAYARAEWRRSALYATLVKAGFNAPAGILSTPSLKGEVSTYVADQMSKDLVIDGDGNPRLTADTIVQFWETIEANQADIEDIKDGMIDNGLDAVLEMLAAQGCAGYKLLTSLQKYHSPVTSGDFAEQIYADLCDGKMVIVDVSTGPQEAVQYVSERILRHLLECNITQFRSGKDCPDIQVYVEEAHRFFSRDHIENNQEDPYVRLAREGAKFDIGLIYATQQVSSVDHQILAETANWIVTHLNSKRETDTLAQYNNFEAFTSTIRSAQDVGFARMVTKSGRYIVPMQFDLFDADRLDQLSQAFEN